MKLRMFVIALILGASILFSKGTIYLEDFSTGKTYPVSYMFDSELHTFVGYKEYVDISVDDFNLLKDILEKNSSYVETLKYQLSEKNQTIANLNQKLDELNKQLSEKDQTIDNLNQKLTELTEQLSEKDQTIENLRQQLIELNKQFLEKWQDIENLRQKLDELSKQFSEKYQELNQKLTELNKQNKQLLEKQKVFIIILVPMAGLLIILLIVHFRGKTLKSKDQISEESSKKDEN